MTREGLVLESAGLPLTGGKRQDPRRFDCPALLVPRKPCRQRAAICNRDGRALNGHFENPATSQPFRPLRLSKCPFSAVENLPPITVCCSNLFSEKDVFQGNEKAGSGKPDGRDPPGTPQSAGCGKGTAPGLAGRRWCQMAHHQSESSRPRHCPMGVIRQQQTERMPIARHAATAIFMLK